MTIKELKALCHVCNLSEILVRISNRIVKISKYEDEGDGAGYDYSIFNASDGFPLDGGVITNEEYSIADVLEELFPATRVAQCFDVLPWEVYETIVYGNHKRDMAEAKKLYYSLTGENRSGSRVASNRT